MSGAERFQKLHTKWITPIRLSVLLCLIEVLFCAVIIWKVSYTEIDWVAYMQEVEGYLSGERNYLKLGGNTGPLVYPAGFLYVFAFIRWICDNGSNIFKAQCIFGGLYVLNLGVVLSIYSMNWTSSTSSITPLWAFCLLVVSKRIHSIFMLRMFNDCIAAMCGYIAVLLFMRSNNRVASFIYSVGVGIKMNMLLYAPGVLLVLLMSGGFQETFVCLSICAIVQLVLAYPFITTFPLEYLSKSFELNRTFDYKWTVNFKFLSEELFVGKSLSLLLLVLTVITVVMFAYKWITENSKAIQALKIKSMFGLGKLDPNFVAITIFSSNFLCIVFARTLHYQFYSWYFHTIPMLLWHTQLHVLVKLLIFAGIEYAFNVFPANAMSSIILQLCHICMLVALYVAPAPLALNSKTKVKSK